MRLSRTNRSGAVWDATGCLPVVPVAHARWTDDGLARSISNAINTADIQRNWAKLSSSRKPASSYLISFGQALPEDDPIDCLDILAIDPHLIAQTILDRDGEAGEICKIRHR